MSEDIFRLLAGVVFFTGLGISAYFRRKADRESGEQVSRQADGTVMMTIIRIGGLILWLTPLAYLISPKWMTWSSIGLPDWVRWVGVALGFICVLSIFWLFSSIGRGITPTSATRQEHTLVTHGPYRWVRHPLYTIGATLFISFGLIADNWFVILLGILTFVLMAIRTPQEEANLIEKFGDSYKEYMQKTGRFFPRIGR